MAAIAEAAAAPPDRPAKGWLVGRTTDLLLGCGGLYTLLFVVFSAAGPQIRASQPALLFPLLLTFASMPHYGATLLRVYERARDRRSYALFSIWATLAIAAWFVCGVLSGGVGALLVTVYLTWSPWHYTGQNYGLAVMFLRRRGVALEGVEKRWLYASYVLSYVFVFLMLHQAQPGDAAGGSLPVGIYGLPLRTLGIPAAINAWLQPAVLAAYGIALARSSFGLLRGGPLARLGPAASLALTQALWFVVPSALRQFGWQTRLEVLDWAHHDHYFTWIAAGHAVQYLWVTTFTARHSPGYRGPLAYYGKALTASAGIWMLPALLLGPAALGLRSLDAGLALLIAAAVNVHHFVLDGAIWKLRGRVAEILLRNADDAPDPSRRRPWLRRAVWGACAVGLVAAFWQTGLEELSRRAIERQDLGRAAALEEGLAFIGHDRAQARRNLGSAYLAAGDLERARTQLERSLALEPSLAGQRLLAGVHARAGRPREAALALEQALAFAPNGVRLHRRAARAWLAAGEPARAEAHLARVVELAPKDARAARELAALRAAYGTENP
jgi:hypothetical protein